MELEVVLTLLVMSKMEVVVEAKGLAFKICIDDDTSIVVLNPITAGHVERSPVDTFGLGQ